MDKLEEQQSQPPQPQTEQQTQPPQSQTEQQSKPVKIEVGVLPKKRGRPPKAKNQSQEKTEPKEKTQSQEKTEEVQEVNYSAKVKSMVECDLALSPLAETLLFPLKNKAIFNGWEKELNQLTEIRLYAASGKLERFEEKPLTATARTLCQIVGYFELGKLNHPLFPLAGNVMAAMLPLMIMATKEKPESQEKTFQGTENPKSQDEK